MGVGSGTEVGVASTETPGWAVGVGVAGAAIPVIVSGVGVGVGVAGAAPSGPIAVGVACSSASPPQATAITSSNITGMDNRDLGCSSDLRFIVIPPPLTHVHVQVLTSMAIYICI